MCPFKNGHENHVKIEPLSGSRRNFHKDLQTTYNLSPTGCLLCDKRPLFPDGLQQVYPESGETKGIDQAGTVAQAAAEGGGAQGKHYGQGE